MSDNEIEQAILNAMKQTAPDLLKGEQIAHDILGALKKLQESSGGKLRFIKGWWEKNGDILVTAPDIIVTEKYTPAELVLKITPLGEIFTNVPLYPMRPDEDAQSRLSALHRNFDANGVDDAHRAEMLKGDPATVAQMALEARDMEILHEDRVLSRKEVPAALADLAMKAVLQGSISQKAADSFVVNHAASPAQQAMAKGLARGLEERAMETALLKTATDPILKGLYFLQRLSLLNIEVEPRIAADRSAVDIEITANPPFRKLSVKITPDGKIKVGAEGIPKVATYDVIEGRGMEALKDIAMLAMFAGKISDAPDQPDDAATPEQKAVLEGVYLAKLEMEMAANAAGPLVDGLDLLKELSKGSFDFAVRKVPGSSDLMIRLNPGEQLPQTHINITAGGLITIGDGMNGYNPRYVLDAGKQDDIGQLLRDLARASVFRGEIPLADGQKDAGDLLLSAAREEESPASTETPAQQAIYDGIREGAETVAQTQLAAESIKGGLKFLKDQLKDEFNYKASDTDRSRALITLNPDSPAESFVVVEADGTLRSGYDETAYNAWNDEDVAKVMADVTRNAMLEAARKALRKPRLF